MLLQQPHGDHTMLLSEHAELSQSVQGVLCNPTIHWQCHCIAVVMLAFPLRAGQHSGFF